MKRGTHDTSLMAGLLVSLGVGSLVAVVAMLIEGLEAIDLLALLYFVIAGFLGPMLGRACTIIAVDRLGPSTSVPIQSSAYPFFSVLGGLMFLSERSTVVRLLGICLIVFGIWVLASQEPGSSEARPTSELHTERRWRGFQEPSRFHCWLAHATGPRTSFASWE